MAEDRPFGTTGRGGRPFAAGIASRGKHRSPAGRVFFGLVVIALGVLFTLDNLGVADAGEILRWWPAVLLAYGLARSTGFCCRQNTVVGVLFVFAGAVLLLHRAGLVSTDPWDFWPVVLIVVGAAMVSRAVRRASGPGDASGWGRFAPGEPPPGAPAPPIPGASEPAAAAAMPGDSAARLSSFALLSKVQHKIVSQDFRGGDAAAILGGQSVDLRAARLAGGTATLELLVVWGGVELFVPADWKVSVETLTLLGGFEDATRAPAGQARGHLILKGLVFMGGVEVKN